MASKSDLNIVINLYREASHYTLSHYSSSTVSQYAVSVPMSKWNKDALISLERDLKINVNPDELIDLLERPAGGFMTEGERMSVCEEPRRSHKVGRIIAVLRGKGDREFDIFLKLLRNSGNEAWAGRLEEEARRFRRGTNEVKYYKALSGARSRAADMT